MVLFTVQVIHVRWELRPAVGARKKGRHHSKKQSDAAHMSRVFKIFFLQSELIRLPPKYGGSRKIMEVTYM